MGVSRAHWTRRIFGASKQRSHNHLQDAVPRLSLIQASAFADIYKEKSELDYYFRWRCRDEQMNEKCATVVVEGRGGDGD
jgi:hypothetical protein